MENNEKNVLRDDQMNERNLEGLLTSENREKPLVTIVTAVLNDCANIEKTIKSVVDQTYEKIEYIVIDGGSTDGTLDIIQKYKDRIDIGISEPDDGIYHAMNKGIDLASGEWINFMNSNDTFYENTTVEKIFSRSHADFDFIYGDYVWKKNDRLFQISARPLDQMWQKISFSHQSLFSRTSIMKMDKFETKYKIVSDYAFYYPRYVNGSRFYKADVIVAVVSADGVSDNLFFTRTLERWHVVRQYSNSFALNRYYVGFIMANIKEKVLNWKPLRLTRKFFKKFSGR